MASLRYIVHYCIHKHSGKCVCLTSQQERTPGSSMPCTGALQEVHPGPTKGNV